jgi:hypothetical protein
MAEGLCWRPSAAAWRQPDYSLRVRSTQHQPGVGDIFVVDARTPQDNRECIVPDEPLPARRRRV